jgi:hypothetical protein
MLQRACDARKELEINEQGRKQTCHHAGPGMVKRKKLRVLQTMERGLPGAIGTLKEHMSTSHFFSPIKGSFTGISILQPQGTMPQNFPPQICINESNSSTYLILYLLQPSNTNIHGLSVQRLLIQISFSLCKRCSL